MKFQFVLRFDKILEEETRGMSDNLSILPCPTGFEVTLKQPDDLDQEAPRTHLRDLLWPIFLFGKSLRQATFSFKGHTKEYVYYIPQRYLRSGAGLIMCAARAYEQSEIYETTVSKTPLLPVCIIERKPK